jgi:hypothetical protein
MEGKVELRVKVPELGTTPVLTQGLATDVVLGTNYIIVNNVGGLDLDVWYTIGSMVELRAVNPPFGLDWFGFVAQVDAPNSVIYFTQPIDIALPTYTSINALLLQLGGTIERVDLYEEETIQQNYQFQDINNLAPVGQFTRDFRVPYTDHNAKVFGAYYDANYIKQNQNLFDEKIEASILVDGLPIVNGVARLISIVKNANGWDDLQLCFYGTTPQFLLDIKDKKLGEITTLSWLNHVVNQYSILSFNIIRDPIIYTPLQRGRNTRLVTGGILNGTPNYPSYEADATSNLLTYLTPCLRWDWIFNAIISGAGYELDGAALMDELAEYWAPWLGPTGTAINTNEYKWRCVLQGQNTTGALLYWGSANQVYAGPLNTTPLIPGRTNSLGNLVADSYSGQQWFAVIDSGGLEYSDGVFEAPITATYTFACKTRIVRFGGVAEPSDLNMQVFPVLRQYVLATGTFTTHTLPTHDLNTIGVGLNSMHTDTIAITMEAGDRLAMSFKSNNGSSASQDSDVYYAVASAYNPISNPFGTSIYDTGFELVSVSEATGGGYIRDMRWDAPDVLQSDFVMDVLKMHNCVIVGDRLNPRKLRVEPIVSYLGSGGVEDWTTKLDTSKDVVLQGVSDYQKKDLTFTYSAGADTLSKLFTSFGRVYGEYKLTNGYPIDGYGNVSAFIDGSLNIKLVTQSTPSRALNIYTSFAFAGRPAPHFETIQNDGTATATNEYCPPGLRCLYAAEWVATEWYFTGATVNVEFPILSHYDKLYPTLTDNDLNWAPETPLYSGTTQPYNNLFNKYWREYLDGIYSGRARLMVAHFALELTDILTFDFSKYYWIKDAYWRVISIRDYKYGKNESTEVTLMKVINNASQCELVPTSSNPDGSINWEDNTGTPVTGNAICCSLYGYTWNNTKQKCFSFGIRSDVGVDVVGVINRPMEAKSEAITSVSNTITNAPAKSVLTGSNLVFDEELKDTIIASGTDITINGEVSATQVFGYNNKLENVGAGDITRGAQLSGANAWVKTMGRHFGGGYRDNTTPMGAMQTGEVLLYNAAVFPYPGYEQSIYLDNGQGLALPEDSTWFITIESVASDNNGFFIFSEYNGVILNKGGTLVVLYLNPKFLGDSVGNQFQLEPKLYANAPYFDTTLKVNDIGAMGYLFPTPGLTLTCRIKYVQTR